MTWATHSGRIFVNPALTCLYFANAIVLLLHEMDSAYWEEWRLFGLPGGEPGFLGMHIPLTIVLLLGLVGPVQGTRLGLLISLFIGLAGLFAFGIHTYQRKQGVKAFESLSSRAVLWATLLLSLPQVALALNGFFYRLAQSLTAAFIGTGFHIRLPMQQWRRSSPQVNCYGSVTTLPCSVT
jgi:hypothetical protein